MGRYRHGLCVRTSNMLARILNSCSQCPSYNIRRVFVKDTPHTMQPPLSSKQSFTKDSLSTSNLKSLENKLHKGTTPIQSSNQNLTYLPSRTTKPTLLYRGFPLLLDSSPIETIALHTKDQNSGCSRRSDQW